MFDPPYVHYDSRNGNGNEDYQRLNYVKRQLEEYLNKIDSSERSKIYIDLAAGSSTKHLFDIKVYDEEHDPDYSHAPRAVKIPAIPVLPKHNDKPDAIQKYSFTIKSISDKKISILRIYAEDDMIDSMRGMCENWFTTEFNAYMEEREKTTSQIRQKTLELEEYKKRLSEIDDKLGVVTP